MGFLSNIVRAFCKLKLNLLFGIFAQFLLHAYFLEAKAVKYFSMYKRFVFYRNVPHRYETRLYIHLYFLFMCIASLSSAYQKQYGFLALTEKK